MKTGNIFDIKRFAIHDGPGIRTTVFLKGCPLNCVWCHNPEGLKKESQIVYHQSLCVGCRECIQVCNEKALSMTSDGIVTDTTVCCNCGECAEVCPASARERVGKIKTVPSIMNTIKKDIPFYDTSGGGVTFSGGEPLAQAEFLLALLKGCGREEIHRVVDTSGYADTETILQVAGQTDLFLFDLKFISPEKHRRYTGVTNQQILNNLKTLARSGSKIIVRIPLIPGINDDENNILGTCTLLGHLPQIKTVHILPFHTFQKSKYEKFAIHYGADAIKPPSAERVEEVKSRIEAVGPNVKVGG